MEKGIIYKITNKINGKVYIGQTKNFDRRMEQHRTIAKRGSKNTHLYHAIQKYGWSNFTPKIVERVNYNNIDEREIYWIQYYKSTNSVYGYNMTYGGEGVKPTSETRKRMSKAQMGKNNSMYGRRGKLSPSWGRTHTEEAKRKMSISRSGRNNPWFGIGFRKGKVGKDNAQSKTILCIETGKVYESKNLCAKAMNISGPNIGKVCKGLLKSAGGYTFKYIQRSDKIAI